MKNSDKFNDTFTFKFCYCIPQSGCSIFQPFVGSKQIVVLCFVGAAFATLLSWKKCISWSADTAGVYRRGSWCTCTVKWAQRFKACFWDFKSTLWPEVEGHCSGKSATCNRGTSCSLGSAGARLVAIVFSFLFLLGWLHAKLETMNARNVYSGLYYWTLLLSYYHKYAKSL